MRHFGKAAAFAGALACAGPVIAQEHNPFDWRSVPEQDDQITMKIGHSVNMEWSSHTATLKRFAELVAIYSNNEIKPEIFPGSQLGGEREMMQQARQGALQVTFPATNNAAALAPSLNVFILPYLATSTSQVNYLQDELTEFLNPRVIDEAGVRIVGWENSGWRAFFYKSDEPITKPSDLANLKMRVPPNPIMIATYEAWGGNPTPIAWNELYGALQQGVVEGGDNPVTDVIGMKFNEVINRMTTFHYTILTHPIVVSERWFQGLSDEHKAVIERAGEEATAYIRWWQPLDEERWWDQAREAGVEITAIEDESEWIEKARAIWPDYYDAIGPDGEAVVAKVMELLEAYPGDQ
jgi:tripartite ATP-independent transporter DctP family solute receptor